MPGLNIHLIFCETQSFAAYSQTFNKLDKLFLRAHRFFQSFTIYSGHFIKGHCNIFSVKSNSVIRYPRIWIVAICNIFGDLTTIPKPPGKRGDYSKSSPRGGLCSVMDVFRTILALNYG